MAGFMIAGPNEALITSGGSDVPKVVVGGRVFVIPIVQKAQRLSLEVMTLTVETSKVYTSEGGSGFGGRRGPGEGRAQRGCY